MRKKPVSVVLGGSRGMGLEIARELGKRGPVVFTGRNEKGLAEAANELGNMGIENYPFCSDVSELKSVQALAQFAAEKGPITYVVNSAGISGCSPDGEKRRVFEINAIGTIHVVEVFYPMIVEGGVQINISSMGRFSCGPDLDGRRSEVFRNWRSRDFIDQLLTIIPPGMHEDSMAYSLSKEFVAWFTLANAMRYGRRGVRIVSVSPGSYDTSLHHYAIDMLPSLVPQLLHGTPVEERWGHPYELAALVDFLCSPGAGYISGTDILADGGYTAANVTMKEDQIEDAVINADASV